MNDEFPKISEGFRTKIRAAIREMCERGGQFCIELQAIPLFNFPKYKLRSLLCATLTEDIDYQWELVDESRNVLTAMATCDGARRAIMAETDLRPEAREIMCEAIDAYKGRSQIEPQTDEVVSSDVMKLLEAIRLKIDDHGIGKRNDFTKQTIETYARFLSECRNGKCPISQVRIVTENAEMLGNAQVDHYYSREYNAIIGGWIVSEAENQKLRNPAYRATVNSRFLTFHEDLKLWIQSRQPELFEA